MSEFKAITEMPVEVREVGGKPAISGYAVVFNSMSSDLGGYREIVASSALDESLAAIAAGKADCLARCQHNGGLQLIGRCGNGSLKLEKDVKGIRYTITPPDTQAGRDMVALVEGGYITRSSFAFSLRGSKGATWDNSTLPPTRTLRNITLHDVSPVDVPAYEATLAEVRASARVVLGNTEPEMGDKSRVEIRERENGGKWAEVYLLDEIVPSYVASYFQDGLLMGSKQVIDILASVPDAERIDVFINSPGGDVFEGLAIYNTLKDHPAPVSVFVRGLAASAASYIAMAGDTIQIGEGGFMMIHNAWTGQRGNASEMRKMAMLLDKIDDSIAGIYSRRTAQDQKQIERWMDAETWLTAEEALDKGFADRVGPVISDEEQQRHGDTCRRMEFRGIPREMGGSLITAPRLLMTDEDYMEATRAARAWQVAQ